MLTTVGRPPPSTEIHKFSFLTKRANLFQALAVDSGVLWRKLLWDSRLHSLHEDSLKFNVKILILNIFILTLQLMPH